MSGRLWLRAPPSTSLRTGFESLRVSGKRSVPRLERLLDRDGALQRLRRGAERGHEAIAHRLHLAPAVRLQGLPNHALVLAQQVTDLRVAEALRHRGGAFDVGEEDGVDGRGRRCWLGASDRTGKLFDEGGHTLIVPVVDGEEARMRNAGRQLLPGTD